MDFQEKELAEIWGQAATYTEYSIDDRICYTVAEQTYTGSILWICAPTTKENKNIPIRYIVQPDDAQASPVVVYSGDIVCADIPQRTERQDCSEEINGKVIIGDACADEIYPQKEHSCILSAFSNSEQALLELLACLPVPIAIQVKTDDCGNNYYLWYVGESTPERPFGLYAGTHGQFLGAVRLALIKAMKHIQEHG